MLKYFYCYGILAVDWHLLCYQFAIILQCHYIILLFIAAIATTAAPICDTP